MIDWNLVVAVSASCAAIWAVIVAHRANGIAKKALPPPRIEFEASRVPMRGDTWQVVNVGDIELQGVQMVHFEGGRIPDLHTIEMTTTSMEPGAALEFTMVPDQGVTPRMCFVGFEPRGEGSGVHRSIIVEFR